VEAVCLRLDFEVPSYSTGDVYTHVEQVIARLFQAMTLFFANQNMKLPRHYSGPTCLTKFGTQQPRIALQRS
jgi:hypothetical protein